MGLTARDGGDGQRLDVRSRRDEISHHEVRIFLVLRRQREWMPSIEVARLAKAARRTARAHLKRFTDLGLCEVSFVSPGFRYRWADRSDEKNSAYLNRLELAAKAFGLAEQQMWP